MAYDPNDDLQRAIALIRQGRPKEARPLLEGIVAANPEHEVAWLWLATASTDRAERIRFLQRVLTINPANERARTAYVQLTGQPPAGPPVPPASAEEPSPRGARPAGLLILLAVIAIGVTAVLLGLYLRDQANGEDGSPQPATSAAQETLPPTPALSPTPSRTSAPTVTPGPSPTSVWDSDVPTWTPSVTHTPPPTQPIVTWTPRPPTETPTAIPTEAPEPTARPTRTPTTESGEDDNGSLTGED